MTIRLPALGVFFLVGIVGAQDLPRLANNDTVTVLADEAWEELEQQVTHFRGNFRLYGPDWSVTADSAVLYGPLDDPERVVADGSPARILVEKSAADGEVTGHGSRIEYLRAEDIVQVTGDAQIINEGNSMSSSLLRYDLAAERITASGQGGVKMTVDPNG